MKTKVIYFLGILLLSFSILGFVYAPITLKKDELSQPIDNIVLPEILHEISGLTDVGPTTIACIQDEQGIIFIYDFVQKEITEKIKFGDDGDYEGITRVDDDIFVLRSDGVLFQVNYKGQKNAIVTQFETGIPAKNNEALCYDEVNNRLLIGSKIKSGKGSNNDERHIYAFDLTSDSLDSTPAYTLNKKAIIDFADSNKIQLPTTWKKNADTATVDLKLGVSGISIHPKTQDLYVLCAIDYLFLIYNQKGELKEIKALNKIKYPQAEGITFGANGDLFISNEGQDGEPSLIRFKN